MTTVLLVCGSTAAASATARLLDRVHRELAGGGHRVVRLDLADLDPAALLRRDHADPGVARSIALARTADALVLGTPVHNASCSAALKAWLDVLPRGALAGRRVLTAACGHSPGARRSVDDALRPVLHAMGAEHVEPGVFATVSRGAPVGSAVSVCSPTTFGSPARRSPARLVSVG